jgi:hypothetical protein
VLFVLSTEATAFARWQHLTVSSADIDEAASVGRERSLEQAVDHAARPARSTE